MWQTDFDHDKYDCDRESKVMKCADFGDLANNFPQRIKKTCCDKPHDQIIDLFDDDKFFFLIN